MLAIISTMPGDKAVWLDGIDGKEYAQDFEEVEIIELGVDGKPHLVRIKAIDGEHVVGAGRLVFRLVRHIDPISKALDMKMTIGKYKGKRLLQVICDDPCYLHWLAGKNVDGVIGVAIRAVAEAFPMNGVKG